MTISVLIAGGLTIPVYKVLSGTSDTDVYTATGKQERVVAASLTNTSGGAIVTKLMWRRAGAVVDVVFFVRSIPANDTVIVDYPVRLLEGDIIKANGNTGITVNLAVLNDNGPLGSLFGGG